MNRPFMTKNSSGVNTILFDRDYLKDKQIVELGCGLKKLGFEDAITVDSRPEVNPTIVCDILNGVPLPDKSADLVYCSHFLEHFMEDHWNHLPGWDEQDRIIGEVHRLMKDDGDFLAIVPSPHSGMAQAVGHKTVYLPTMWKAVLSRKFKFIDITGIGTWIDIPEMNDMMCHLSQKYPFFGKEYFIWCRKESGL